MIHPQVNASDADICSIAGPCSLHGLVICVLKIGGSFGRISEDICDTCWLDHTTAICPALVRVLGLKCNHNHN